MGCLMFSNVIYDVSLVTGPSTVRCLAPGPGQPAQCSVLIVVNKTFIENYNTTSSHTGNWQSAGTRTWDMLRHTVRTNLPTHPYHGYNEFHLHPLPRRQPGHFPSLNHRHVRRRKKYNRQWPSRRRQHLRGDIIDHQPDELRGFYNDLILSETRRHRHRRPQYDVYYNRYRDEYYYWDLDPYSVLGLLQLTINISFNSKSFQGC